MNIFHLDNDPKKCAFLMTDTHIVKMRAESIQMLVTAKFLRGEYNFFAKRFPPRNAQGDHYSRSYENHPCTQWAADSTSNWLWLCRHLQALCLEFDARYGTPQHSATTWLKLCTEPLRTPERPLTVRPQCYPDKYSSYREYYLAEKTDKLWYGFKYPRRLLCK